MVMKPYVQKFYAPYYMTGNQGTNIVQSRVIGTRSLGDVVSRHGNYKTPNPHGYTSSRSWGLQGTVLDFSGKYYTKKTGAQPYVFNWSVYDEAFDEGIYNEALAQVYEKLRGSVDLSVDAFQWRTIKQMVSLRRRLIDMVGTHVKRVIPVTNRVEKALRLLDQANPRSRRAKRLRKEVRRGVETLARARLEFVYGWKPSYDTFRELAKGALRTGEAGMIACEGKSKSVRTRNVEQFSIDPKIPLRFTVTISQRVRIKTWFNPRPGVLDQLAQLSSLNPISVAYELIPYSFVLDWAVNISGYLRTMESAFTYRNDFVTGFVTRTRRLTVSARMDGINRSGPNSGTQYSLGGEAVKTTFNRSGLAAAPFPTYPRLKLKLTESRSLNALALVGVNLRKADKLIEKFKH